MHKYDVIIIGGGLAGLCNAIHLAKFDKKVVLIEKNEYPKHKVCGEYISNEVLPYLDFLGFNPFDFDAVKIDKFQLSTKNNKLISSNLPLGGFGISRYKIDLELYKLAKTKGVTFIKDTVTNIHFENDEFTIETKEDKIIQGKTCIGAFGKRSLVDKKLDRDFIKKKSPYLAVKIHVKGNFKNDLVALHNFKGGYCGVSKVENNAINLCYITDFEVFKKYKNITEFQEQIVFKNKYLREIFTESEPVFEQPLSISQISFETKKPVENHVLMSGDAAGLIHPLCGNGMSMAIHSAKICATLLLTYFNNEIDRTELEKKYTKEWNKTFKARLSIGHFIASLFRKEKIASFLLDIIKYVPFILPKIIKQTHGKPITI